MENKNGIVFDDFYWLNKNMQLTVAQRAQGHCELINVLKKLS